MYISSTMMSTNFICI